MLLVTIVQVPFLQGVFRTQVLSLADWGLVVGAAFTVTPVLEIVKWRQRKHAL
jgi:hypothetical protein